MSSVSAQTNDAPSPESHPLIDSGSEDNSSSDETQDTSALIDVVTLHIVQASPAFQALGGPMTVGGDFRSWFRDSDSFLQLVQAFANQYMMDNISCRELGKVTLEPRIAKQRQLEYHASCCVEFLWDAMEDADDEMLMLVKLTNISQRPTKTKNTCTRAVQTSNENMSSTLGEKVPAARLEPSLEVLEETSNCDLLGQTQAETERYVAMRTKEAANNVLMLLKKALWFFGIFAAAQLRNGASWQYFFACCFPTFLLLIPIYSMASELSNLISSHPIVAGSILQVVVYFVMTATVVYSAPLVPLELMKHRIYLTAAHSVFAGLPMYAYVPFKVFCGAICPIFLAGWFVFHYSVDFLNVSVIVCGIAHCAFVGHMFRIVDRNAWSRHQALIALDQERDLLKATQATLNNMLSSLFDASCVCDAQGRLVQCTPQLHLLVGKSNMTDIDLASLASSRQEEIRLRNFLEHTAKSATQQAMTIQVSLRDGSSPAQKVGLMPTVEAVLYGIVLPRRHASESKLDPQEGGALFIGLQTREPVVHQPGKADFRDVDSTSSGVEDFRDEDSTSSVTSHDFQRHLSANDHNVGTLPAAIFADLRNTPGQSRCRDSNYAQSRGNHSPRSSLSALTYSLTVSSQCASQMAVSKCSIATQTDFPMRCRPPKVPNRKPLPRPNVDLLPPDCSRPGRCRVVLNSSRRILQDFQATPHKTISTCLECVLLYINSHGVGCCPYHIGIKTLRVTLRRMQEDSCKGDGPMRAWQCRSCLSMNAAPAVCDEAIVDATSVIVECQVCCQAQANFPLRVDSPTL